MEYANVRSANGPLLLEAAQRKSSSEDVLSIATDRNQEGDSEKKNPAIGERTDSGVDGFGRDRGRSLGLDEPKIELKTLKAA